MSRLTIAAGALGAAAIVGVPIGIATASPGTEPPADRRSETKTSTSKSDLDAQRISSVEKKKADAAQKAEQRKQDVAHLKNVLRLNDVLHLNNVRHLNNVIHFNNVVTLNRTIAANEAARAEAAAQAQAAAQAEAAQAQAAEQARASTRATSSRSSVSTRSTYQAPAASAPSNGRCGGSLPPCFVMDRESGGSLTAHNPTSSAAGKWQFLDSTWNGYGGYASADQAPESVQDAKAAELWNGGSGCSAWSAC